ncbi:hypothetical protein NX059_007556 [Plenodomus lindquistii]|nr:hypothetical protein NX059_007556 [Plenodomus lindquistii]
MKRVDPQKPPKPCDYFDLICGTSTGGLIAIMLGRLGMDVEECIKVYQDLSSKVFTPKRGKYNLLGKGKDLWQLSGSFDGDKLAQEVQDIIVNRGSPAGAKLLEQEGSVDQPSFVCAIRTEINKPVRLRSYTTAESVDEVDCTIWEAARATSAASSFFSHIDIQGQRFTDGATECNNPIEDVVEEADDIWVHSHARMARILSIGTGRPNMEAFGENLLEVGKTLVRLSTDAEQSAERFQRLARERGLEDVYYRFKVLQGLEDVGLEASDQQGKIWAATNHYLNGHHVKQQCKGFATLAPST